MADAVSRDSLTAVSLKRLLDLAVASSAMILLIPLSLLIAAAINAAVTKAAPNYMPLARQANAQAMIYPGPGFPGGPYLPEQGQPQAAAR